MIETSDQWARALASSHGIVTVIDVLHDGEPVAEDIPFTDGSVDVDRGSEVRRELSLTVPDPSVFPTSETDLYAPYGQQLRVRRGIRFGDGLDELLDIGYFRIEEISGDVHFGPLSITAPGLESIIRAEPFPAPTPTFGTHASWIEYQLQEAYPAAEFVDESTEGATALPLDTYDAGADRWSALTDVATAVGAELFCGPDGTFLLRDIPDPDDFEIAPDWTVNAGERGVMVSAAISRSSESVYNRVVVRSENTSDEVEPFSGSATLDDEDHPLRWGGPFGRRTLVYETSLVANASHAEGMARALLREYSAGYHTVDLESVPNPALDAGDRIRVVYGSGHDPEIHVVQSLTIPLTPEGGAARITTMSGREEPT